MSEAGVFTIHTDGGARGNPGPAAFAYVIERDGAPPVEETGTLGRSTNNVAEYTALVRALEHAARLGARRLLIHSDSELMVKQMNGEYAVKNEDLLALYRQAKALAGQFDEVKLRHVRREQNTHADRLYNDALDAIMGRPAAPAASKKPLASPAAKLRQKAVRDEALLCLRAAAAEWARGDANVPTAEQVWDQLWSILEEGGLLRAIRRDH